MRRERSPGSDEQNIPQVSLFGGSLNLRQKAYAFNQLKLNIAYIVEEHELQDEFQYKLLMTAPDPDIFLNILAGWRDSASDKTLKALDTCIRTFDILYPEVYKQVNAKQPIYKLG